MKSSPGDAEAAELAADPVDVVLNGITGSIGLRPTLAALAAGSTLALANKESLIAGGELVRRAAQASPHDDPLIPVDSEHSAIAQALASGPGVNPLGDEVVAELGEFWTNPCHPEHVAPERPAAPQNPDDSDDSEHSDDSGRPSSSEPRHRPEPPVPHEPGSSRNPATPPANPPEHHESEAS